MKEPFALRATRGSLGSRLERRRDDAAGETLVAQGGPKGSRDELAEGRGTGSVGSGRGVDKVEGAVEEMGSVLERDVVGPSDVLVGPRDGVGLEFDALEVFDDTVGGSAITVPEWPPAAVVFGKGGVRRGRREEVAVVGAVGRRVGGKTIRVDLDEGVLGPEDVLKAVGDEEEAVGGSENGLVKGGRI